MTSSRSLSIAAAVALALSAGSASALDFATTQALASAAPVGSAANAPNLLVTAGASALRLSFLQLLNQDICVPGTLDVYRAFPTANHDFRAYSCQTVANTGLGSIGATLGAAANSNVVIPYRSEGGSAWGPVSISHENALGVGFAGVASLNLGAGSTCTNTSTLTTIDGVLVRTHDCPVAGYSLATDNIPAGLVQKTTDLATSDVEPKLFIDTNNPASVSSRFSSAPAVVAATKALAYQTGFGQVFNLIVNNSAVAANISDEVSNLKTSEALGILSGSINDWCQLPALAANASCVGGTPHPITVVRREPGSGTQVSAGVHFNRVGCGDSFSFVVDADAPGAPDTDFVIEAGATGVLETTVRDTLDSIGINIAKGPIPLTGVKALNLDGVVASNLNAANLTYLYAYEATFSKANTTVMPAATLKLALADGIIALSKAVNRIPANISVFAIPSGTNIPGTTGTLGQPVGLGTRIGLSCRGMQPQ